MRPPLLQVRNLWVKYGTATAVGGVSFSLRRNRTLGIVGESGSGKSTLIWALTQLLPAEACIAGGQVLFEGKDLLQVGPDGLRSLRGRRIAYISQDPLRALAPSLTVGQQMMDALYRDPGTLNEKRARVLAALTWVNLPDPDRRMDMYPHQLSGGQCQRVAIAMALMLEPDLVLADEPTTALDATHEVEVLELLKQLQYETGTGIVFVTHHLSAVERLCDAVMVLQGGNVKELGPTRSVLKEPRSAYTRMLLRCDPARLDQPTRRLPTMADGPDAELVVDRGVPGRISAKAPAVLTVDDLSVSFRVPSGLPRWMGGKPACIPAVKGVSFEIRKGETAALVGESGSGKTSIARAVLGLQPYQGGRITVCGYAVCARDPETLRLVRSKVAMMHQEAVGSLSPRMTVGRQVIEPLVLAGCKDVDLTRRSRELLRMVGLEADYAEAYPHQLSGGQARRVGVARALALSPKLIVADEPTAGLDVSIQGEVLNLLNEVQDRTGLSILLITHNMNVVRHCADRVMVMRSGRIIEAGRCEDVIGWPRQPYTEALIRAALHRPPEQARPE